MDITNKCPRPRLSYLVQGILYTWQTHNAVSIDYWAKFAINDLENLEIIKAAERKS